MLAFQTSFAMCSAVLARPILGRVVVAPQFCTVKRWHLGGFWTDMKGGELRRVQLWTADGSWAEVRSGWVVGSHERHRLEGDQCVPDQKKRQRRSGGDDVCREYRQVHFQSG